MILSFSQRKYLCHYANYDDALGYVVRLYEEAAQRTGLEHNLWDTIRQSTIFPFYLVQLLAPWSVLVLFFFRKDLLSIIRATPILSFCVIFILFNLPLYWFTAEHKARYLYMFFPFFCILFAYFFIKAAPGLLSWKKRINQLFFGIMVLITLTFLSPPFIPETACIPNIIWKSLLLTSAGIGLTVFYRKVPKWQLHIFILFIILLRLGINLTYLPATAKYSSRLIYQNHINQVLAITKTEPVHWTGKPYTFTADASIGSYTIKNVYLTSAPLVAYQIPYYLTKANGHLMQYDTSLQANRFYLAHKSSIENLPVKGLYRFPDKWMEQEVVVFRAE